MIKMGLFLLRNSKELKNISKKQLEWLLSGLKIEQKNSFKEFEIKQENIVY